MSDTLGRITVPAPVVSGLTWPNTLVTDYPFGYNQTQSGVTHKFGSLASKASQRFLTGIGPRVFPFRRKLSQTLRRTLANFYESVQGSYQSFVYNAPLHDGGTTPVQVVFESHPLSFQELAIRCQVGFNFLECLDAASTPSYPINYTCVRFPNSTMASGLTSQEQEIIPLVQIDVRDPAVPTIYISDRRCNVGSNLYLPRLLGIGEEGSGVLITQTLSSVANSADEVQFTLGNADRAITKLVNDCDLSFATITLSLYHKNTGGLLDQLWQGHIRPGDGWAIDGTAKVTIRASDGIYQLAQLYPRTVSRTCDKFFNDGKRCPYSTKGSGGNPSKCSYYLSTPFVPGDPAQPGGCVEHGMSPANDGKAYFGGHPFSPQGVNIRDNSNKKQVTATSIGSDSIFGHALPDIWCNDDGDANKAFDANALLMSYRDESDFADGLGIVGSGPLGEFTGTQLVTNADGFPYDVGPKLDGFLAQGFTVDSHGNITGYHPEMGLREVFGNDPADIRYDAFSLGQGTPQVWDLHAFAAGTSFVELRIKKASEIQPSTPEQHVMKIPISKGLMGLSWNTSGTQLGVPGMTNVFWVAISTYLKALGLFTADSGTQLSKFVLSSLTNSSGSGCADVADLSVPLLFGSGTEKQFRFQGSLDQQKPLRDWLTEILAVGLGFFTWQGGALKLGCRYNASAVSAFTLGNILFQSLSFQPIAAGFDGLRIDFADRDYQFQANTADYTDKDHADYYGRHDSPLISFQHSLGSASLSQSTRLAAIRTREEIGGVTPFEWATARNVTLKTTILALETEVGQVVSIQHPELVPDPTTSSGLHHIRIERQIIHSDWSITIQGRTVRPSMYDLTVGPKPTDVLPQPLPVLFFPQPINSAWAPYQDQASASDALWPSEWTFDVAQSYTELASGVPVAKVIVTGKQPVNQFIPGCGSPVITAGTMTINSTGGTIPGGITLRIAVCATDQANGAGKCSPPSRILVAQVPAGTNTNSIVLDNILWPSVSGLAGYVVFYSDKDQLICAQQTGSLSAGSGNTYSPATITITAAPQRSTWALPNPNVKLVRVRGKRLVHGGVIGGEVSAVSGNQVTSGEIVDSAGLDNWAGRKLIILGRPQGSIPFASFNIVSFDPITGVFLLDRPATGVNVGDLFAVSFLGYDNSANPYLLRDTGIANMSNPDPHTGLPPAPYTEAGLSVLVIAGYARGATANISSSTADSWTLDFPLSLDSTSVWVIVAPTWEYLSESNVSNSSQAVSFSHVLVVDNYINQPLLIGGFMEDTSSNETNPDVACYRCLYITGESGTAKVNSEITITINDSPYTMDGLIQYIHCDTSISNGQAIEINANPMATFPLDAYYVDKSEGDADIVHLNSASGESWAEGPVITLDVKNGAAGGRGIYGFTPKH